MTIFATLYDSEEARKLAELLEKEQIVFEIRTTVETSGIDTIEFAADTGGYDSACAITEKWAADCATKSQLQSRRPCPQCHSKRLVSVDHEELGWVDHCQDCGCLITS